MRLFIAVDLAEELKDYLNEQQAAMKEFCQSGNFSRRENLHLTVKFLGEVDVGQLSSIQMAMDEAVRIIKPFYLELNRWGYFSRGHKKILWVGLKGDMDQFEKLFYQVEEALEPLGFPKETRKLKAHITMAREAVLNKPWKEIMQSLPIENREIPVDRITLMESTRVNKVLVYKPLYESSF